MFKQVIYSFPIQLLFKHLKGYQLLLGCWVILTLAVTSQFGSTIGIPYLFLDPEYLNKVGFWSFFIIGTSLGILIVSYSLTSYILHAKKYPFLARLEKSFEVFSLNNALFPALFVIIYTSTTIYFQVQHEELSLLNLIKILAALYLGMTLILVSVYLFFHKTNQNLFRFLTDFFNRRLKRFGLSRKRVLQQINERKSYRDQTLNYLDVDFHIRPVHQIRKIIENEELTRVFDQNHLNSMIIIVVLLGSFMLMGYGVDFNVFKFPAAASVMLLMAIVIMIVGAIGYWFKGWVLATVIGLMIILNFMFKSEIVTERHEAIGLNYRTVKANYSDRHLKKLNSADTIAKDAEVMIQLLENWKANQKETKPKAIFICVSGGGARSALWTTSAMMNTDQKLDGQLMNKTVMITGASGGMIGACYFRELYLQKRQGKLDSLYAQKNLQQISKDLLNPIIFSLVVNDLFVRKHKYPYEGLSYYKDRGYVFEKQLNINTNYALDKKVMDYQEDEYNAKIPMVLFGPTIMNDGRKLYIAAQHFSFMNELSENQYTNSTIDFMRLFKEQKAADLKFTSALRMNASFPYVTPNVTLPSDPYTKIMDAGVKDNFGITDAVRFVYAFQDWFENNTSGVIFLKIRDTKKSDQKNLSANNLSILDKLLNPISSVYNNLVNLQDISNEYDLGYMRTWFQGEVDEIEISYDAFEDYAIERRKEGEIEIDSTKVKRPSLNWNLTTKEKKSIIRNASSPNNTRKMEELKGLLGE